MTFKVNMSQADIEYPYGVFLVGEPTEWAFVEMEHEGDEIYSVTLTLTTGEPMAYYYIVNDTWDDYLDYRETVPEECVNSAEVMDDPEWDVDRAFIVPEEDVTYAYYWASCETFGEEEEETTTLVKSSTNLAFEVYPNPSNGLFNVTLSSAVSGGKLEVFEITGRSIRKFHFANDANNLTIDITNMPASIYFIKVSSGQKTFTQKVLVK